MKARSLLLTLCMAPLLASAAHVRSAAPTTVRQSEDAIEYRGVISEEANQRVFDLFVHAQRTPRTLLIDSVGGSADAAMELGAWVFKHSLSVSVPTHCLSSCANYVFPAGRIKRLGTHATLLWHGGATQPLKTGELEAILDELLAAMNERERGELQRHFSRSQMLAELEQSHERLVEREGDFFRMLGVDPRIATLGHLHERELLKPGERYAGWDYSLEDLATLGVHDIIVNGDRAWTPTRTTAAGRVFRVRLEDLAEFTPMTDDSRP